MNSIRFWRVRAATGREEDEFLSISLDGFSADSLSDRSAVLIRVRVDVLYGCGNGPLFIGVTTAENRQTTMAGRASSTEVS